MCSIKTLHHNASNLPNTTVGIFSTLAYQLHCKIQVHAGSLVNLVYLKTEFYITHKQSCKAQLFQNRIVFPLTGKHEPYWNNCI